MAKKMLINADMLLATPRRNEPIAPSAPIQETIVEERKIEAPPSVQSTPLVAKSTPAESSPSSHIEKAVEPPITRDEKKRVEISSVQRGLKQGETRATFIVKEDALEKIKAIAYWDRQNIKDIVQIAIDAYIKQYENAKGVVQPIP